MMTTQYVIYALKNVLTGAHYVGQSKQPQKRRERHFNDLRLGKHHSSKLQAAFDTYGELAFQWKLLQINIAESESSKYEIFWIATLDSFNGGYNHNNGSYELKPAIPCSWNGQQFASLSEAARTLDITVTTMSWRLGRGYTCDEDSAQFGTDTTSKPVVWNGVLYPSRNACCKALGISMPALLKRLRKGYTSDADLQGKGKAA